MTTTTENAVSVGTSRMSIFIAAPDGAGPHPAVVIAHHRDGVDEFTRRVCDAPCQERLPRRRAQSLSPPARRRGPDRIAQVSRRCRDGRRPQRHCRILQSQKSPRADRIGIIGHCMGGRTSFLGAATNAAFKCAGIFYGGSILAPRKDTAPAPSDARAQT